MYDVWPSLNVWFGASDFLSFYIYTRQQRLNQYLVLQCIRQYNFVILFECMKMPFSTFSNSILIFRRDKATRNNNSITSNNPILLVILYSIGNRLSFSKCAFFYKLLSSCQFRIIGAHCFLPFPFSRCLILYWFWIGNISLRWFVSRCENILSIYLLITLHC